MYANQQLMLLTERNSVNQIKFWRREYGLSQIDLAHEAGLPRGSIQLIEAGVRPAKPFEKEMLSLALGKQIKDLFPVECSEYRDEK